MTVATKFVNHLGQEIEPGESVLCICRGYRSTKVKSGTYIGMSPSGYPQARVKSVNYLGRTTETLATLVLGRVYKYHK